MKEKKAAPKSDKRPAQRKPKKTAPIKDKAATPRKEKRADFTPRKKIVIYVGNLRYTRDEKGVKFLFSKYGKVKSVKIITDPGTQKSKGIAFVEMMTDKSAREAIQKLNGAQIDGRTLKVSEALPMDENRPKKNFTNNRTAYKRRMIIKNKKSGAK